MRPLSYIQISRQALLHNLVAFKAFVREKEIEAKWGWLPWIAAVVKANAYGHGLDEVVGLLGDEVDCLQVDDLDELRRLRRLTKANILVFGHVATWDVAEATRLGHTELAVYNVAQLVALRRACDEYDDAFGQFSVKVDALLGRLGILPEEADAFIETINHLGFEPTAVYAHYGNIEDTTDLTHADTQEEAFLSVYRKFETQWPTLGHHISATSGLMAKERPVGGSSLLRLGIGLYGLYPSAPLARSHAHLNLQPVMRWVSHLAQVKTLPAGHPVGYGLTYRTTRPTTIGIVPQGYSDGYDRGLSNVGEVLVHGRRCPVIGRVAMNMFAIDLTPAPDARAEDEVVLLGSQGEDRITAEEIAQKLGTINYEVVAPRLPAASSGSRVASTGGGTVIRGPPSAKRTPAGTVDWTADVPRATSAIARGRLPPYGLRIAPRSGGSGGRAPTRHPRVPRRRWGPLRRRSRRPCHQEQCLSGRYGGSSDSGSGVPFRHRCRR